MACSRVDQVDLQLDAGEALEADHLASCPDCAQRQRLFHEIRGSVRRGPARRGPVAGWQDAVFAAVRPRKAAPHPRRPRWQVLVPTFAVIGIALLLLWLGRPRDPAVLALEVTIRPGPARLRGTPPPTAELGARTAAIGDRLVAAAPTAGAPHAEIRVYRTGGGLVLRCPGQPAGCRADANQLRAELELSAPGRYETLIATSQSPLPAPQDTAAADTNTLIGGGARVTPGPPINVW